MSPTLVDVSPGDQAVTATLRLIDDSSGVSSADAIFASPSGQHFITVGVYGSDRDSGSALDGTYSAQATVSRYAEVGTWVLTDVYTYDRAGNYQDLDAAWLSAAGISASFSVVGATADSSGPQLVSLALGAGSVDVSSGARTITVTLRLTDDSSGVSSADAVFTSPSGQHYITAGVYSSDRTSGTKLDGMYSSQLTVSQYAEVGSWALTDVYTYDQAGNCRDYDSAALGQAGIGASFAVTGAIADSDGPQIKSLSLGTGVVNVSTGDQSLTVTMWLTDDVSGVSSADAVFTSPSGQHYITAGVYGSDRASGTKLDGTYSSPTTVPQNSETGTWLLTDVYTYDQAGNTRVYDANDLAQASVSASFLVTR